MSHKILAVCLLQEMQLKLSLVGPGWAPKQTLVWFRVILREPI